MQVNVASLATFPIKNGRFRLWFRQYAFASATEGELVYLIPTIVRPFINEIDGYLETQRYITLVSLRSGWCAADSNETV